MINRIHVRFSKNGSPKTTGWLLFYLGAAFREQSNATKDDWFSKLTTWRNVRLPAGAILHSEPPKIILPRCKSAAMVAPHKAVARWQDHGGISCFQRPEDRSGMVRIRKLAKNPPGNPTVCCSCTNEPCAKKEVAIGFIDLTFYKDLQSNLGNSSDTWATPARIDADTSFACGPQACIGQQESADPIQVLACWWRCTGERSDPSCPLVPWWFYPGTALDAATEKGLSQLQSDLQPCDESLIRLCSYFDFEQTCGHSSQCLGIMVM